MATISKPARSILSMIAPTTFLRTLSGLMIAKVLSIVVCKLFFEGLYFQDVGENKTNA